MQLLENEYNISIYSKVIRISVLVYNSIINMCEPALDKESTVHEHLF